VRLTILAGSLLAGVLAATGLLHSTTAAGLRTADFSSFYAAGSIVLHGHRTDLYQPATQDPVLRSLLGGDYRFHEYFFHPPFEALWFAALAWLSFPHAYAAWTSINVFLLAALPLILISCVALIARKPHLGLLGFVFFPALATLKLGQDSIVLLVVMSAAYCLMRDKRPLAAGLVLALASIKFQFLIVLAPLLLLERRFRVLAGLAGGVLGLIAVSVWTIGFRQVPDYVHFVLNANVNQEELKQVNVRGLLFALGIQHLMFWSALVSVAVLAVGVLVAVKRHPHQEQLAFAAYLTIAVLASPYAHFPDVAVLLLPILLAVDWLARNPLNRMSAQLLAASIGLMFLFPYVLIVVWPHYSRIYLMFPAVLLFLIALLLEIHATRMQGGDPALDGTAVAQGNSAY